MFTTDISEPKVKVQGQNCRTGESNSASLSVVFRCLYRSWQSDRSK